MIYRGVYSDHSTTLQSARYVGYDIHAAVVRRVASIARLNVNLIWWTNLPDDADILTHVVRTSRERGIECVLGSGRWYAGARPVDQQWATLQGLHAALPADASPWAWSLGDETALTALPDLRTLADRCKAAGIPATMVQVPEYHQQTLTTLAGSLPLLACDVYPVMRPGLGTADNIAWAKREHAAVVARSRAAGVQPLMMTQAFGGDATFAMPTPAHTRWQVWSAVAAGSPGVVVFAAGMPSRDGGPTPPMASLIDWQRQDEQLTAQGAATAIALDRLSYLDSLAESTSETAPAWQGTPARGDIATIRRTAAGRRVLIVVADPDQPARTLRITLPGVTAITPLAGSTGASLSVLPWPWYLLFPPTLAVTLQPGDCWIGII